MITKNLPLRSPHVLLAAVALVVSGCVNPPSSAYTGGEPPPGPITAFFRRVFNTPKASSATRPGLPQEEAKTVARQGTPVDSVDRPMLPDAGIRLGQWDEGPANPRYSILQEQNLRATNLTASKLSTPGQYRVLYFPSESGDSYTSEPHRVTVRIAGEEMRPTPFALTDDNGGISLSSDGAGPRARDYVAPARSVGEAASRLAAPRADASNVYETPGLYTGAEYRRAKVQTRDGVVTGWVRPLKIVGGDPRSRAVATLALNRTAGEQLVYFPHDFGWGGFVADEPDQYFRQQ